MAPKVFQLAWQSRIFIHGPLLACSTRRPGNVRSVDGGVWLVVGCGEPLEKGEMITPGGD